MLIHQAIYLLPDNTRVKALRSASPPGWVVYVLLDPPTPHAAPVYLEDRQRPGSWIYVGPIGPDQRWERIPVDLTEEDFRLLEVRPDGWPLCPRCGQDEVWSPLIWDGTGERPALAAYIAAGLRCYGCSWSSE